MVARPLDLEPTGTSVLVTDDNDGWRDAVDDLLRRAGFQTLLATCGEEAIEVARSQRVDVALIDFHMPRLDGLETLRRIRQFDWFLPVALMTAHPADVPETEVQELHVRFVLTKPVGGRHIVTVVSTLVRARW